MKKRFQSTNDLRKTFEAEKSAERHEERLHPLKEIKGVFGGQYYRIKVPSQRPPPKPVSKLLNPSSPPVKSFVHAEKSAAEKTSSKSASKKPSSTLISELREASQSERLDILNEYWQRAREWWKLNWHVLLLNAGSVCTLVGFTRTDVLELRSLSVAGSLSSVIYFMSLPSRPSMTPVLWSLTFAAVNTYKIVRILIERKAKAEIHDDHDLDVYRRHFEPHGVTPKQFEYIMAKAHKTQLKKGQVLIREGEPLRNIYLITKGHTKAHYMGRKLTAVSFRDMPAASESSNTSKLPSGPPTGGSSGAWVGEMSYFERDFYKNKAPEPDADDKAIQKESADPNNQVQLVKKKSQELQAQRAHYTIVALEDDTTVLYWSHEEMQSLMDRSSDMKSVLTRAMTAAIVGKVLGLVGSRKNSEGGLAWVGRLWQGSTQGPEPPSLDEEPPRTPLGDKPNFSVLETEKSDEAEKKDKEDDDD
jgi:CRP-like cAMP-binding protein